MKFLAMVFAVLLASNASAGLITEVTTSNNQLTIDFSVENFDPNIGQITAEYQFDANELTFAGFTDSDYLLDNFLGFGSAGVIENGVYSLLFIDFLFFSPDQSSFSLGQAVFDIIGNNMEPSLTETLVQYNDLDGNEIVNVPEPGTLILLMAMLAGLLLVRRFKLV